MVPCLAIYAVVVLLQRVQVMADYFVVVEGAVWARRGADVAGEYRGGATVSPRRAKMLNRAGRATTGEHDEYV